MLSDIVKILLVCAGIVAILVFAGVLKVQTITNLLKGTVSDVEKGFRQSEHFAGSPAGPQVDTSVSPSGSGSSDPMPYNNTSSYGQSDKLSPIKHNTNVLTYPQNSNTYSPQPDKQDIYAKCGSGSPLTSADLLPSNDPSNNWGLSNPQVPTNSATLAGTNFIDGSNFMPIDTQGNSLRNANLQLRSDPIVQQIPNITPWGNTTIGPDTNRKQFEIGC